jgi:Family of unknown function (DUF5752)
VQTSTQPFVVKDCALIALATGQSASRLEELRDELIKVDLSSIYHHFWGGLLHARFDEREYNNDFASWVKHRLHDPVLAERLAVLDPGHYRDIDELRWEIVELVEARLEEASHLAWARASSPFEFVSSRIVVFETDRRLREPEELERVLLQLSTSSIFYHFIDARRRTPSGHDDFSDWLSAAGNRYASLQIELESLEPYFGSLFELRDELAAVFARHFRRATS